MHKELEKYLSQIEKQLSTLPTEQREDELREIRSHLEMMIEENIACGCNEEEAVAKALEQFGSTKEIASALKSTRANRDQRARTVLAGLVVFAIWIYPDFCTNYIFPSMRYFLLTPQASYIETAIVFLISGWIAEVIAPRKVLLPILIPFCIVWALGISTVILTLVAFPTSSLSFLSYQLLNTAVLPLAFLGAWIRRRQVKHRQQPQMIAE